MEILRDKIFTLAHALLASIDLDQEAGAAEAWQQEVERRLQNYDQGFFKTVSAAEVFARLAKIAPRR